MKNPNLLFLTCAVIGVAHAQPAARLTLEDLAALSPDGRTFAAVRQRQNTRRKRQP